MSQTERIACKTPGCKGAILPETALRTGGLCMPCVGAIAKRERDEYVRLNRRDLNIYDGIVDPVEILKLIHQPRRHDPLINLIPYPTPVDQLYAALNAEQGRELASFAQHLIGTESNDMAENICRCLSAFTDVNLDDCLRAFLAQGSHWPGMAFRRAPPDVRDELLARAETGNGVRDQVLKALAWIGDAAVVARFARWRNSPPSWRASLYVPPEAYAHEAGWELNELGQRRDLYFKHCTKLVKGTGTPSFRAFLKRSDQCPCCSGELTDLVTVVPSAFNLDQPAVWNGSVSIATCEICTAFGTVFGQVDERGDATWSPHTRCESNADPADWDRFPVDCLSPAGSRPTFSAADDFLPTTFSQLGGHPAWVQDAEYPQCPACAKTMMFVAQIDQNDVDGGYDGRIYAFVCASCRTTATTYQQT